MGDEVESMTDFESQVLQELSVLKVQMQTTAGDWAARAIAATGRARRGRMSAACSG